MTYKQGKMRASQVADDFLRVSYLSRQSEVNTICMSYSGLLWHFVMRGQFGIKE